MKSIRIVFVGSVYFSKAMLEILLKKKVNIVGVCTKKKSSFNSDFYNLGKISKKKRIRTLYTNNINSLNAYNWIKKRNPDLILCLGWSYLIKKKLLSLPRLGVIGFHPASIPQNRGRHPIIWSLVLGLKNISSTFFFMNTKADAGNIITQKGIIIDKKDNAKTLYLKIINQAKKQLIKIMKNINSGKVRSIKQNIKKGNVWRKRNDEDGKIDWRMSSIDIFNLVRGLTKPYPGAHFIHNNKKIILWNSKIIKDTQKNIEPGKIIKKINSKIVVKCGKDAICLLKTNTPLKYKVGDYL